MSLREDALRYHSEGRHGKIEVVPTKPTESQRDLSLAYSPGVAEPCRAIAEDEELSYEYTAKGNLVAVITNGTAVLGLGNIGPLASKPVMEGKGVLFKRFADIDVFDLEVDAPDPEDFIRVVKALAPSFGGINLEDIKAPECYEIETRLKAELSIPVFHDDQHGTAIIASAALLNALEITGKEISQVRIVVNGAGAAAFSCAKLFVELGADLSRVIMLDSKGVIHSGREDLNQYKSQFAGTTPHRTLADAMDGADVFVGLSVGGVVSADMVRSMADDPVVFALANPDPEIAYPDAMAARQDAIVGTGRSDFPNQINNVLGFPFIFRGALDVRAREINAAMKLAAVRALASLAKKDVPESVSEAYGASAFRFGREYLIPKPLDPRALVEVSSAVASAAMESGAARREVDISEYRADLDSLLGRGSQIVREMVRRARLGKPCRIVFPEGADPVILQACTALLAEGIGRPLLVGDPKAIHETMADLGLEFEPGAVEFIDPATDERCQLYAERLFKLRRFKGMSWTEAQELAADPVHFGLLMVDAGDADCLLAGVSCPYDRILRPALQIIRVHDWVSKCSGLYIIAKGDRVYYFADTTVNIDPTPEELAEIAICASEAARGFGSDPRVAFLSFSNPGNSEHPHAVKVREALKVTRARYPDLPVLGEIQADLAIDASLREARFGDPIMEGHANVLVFPTLDAANIAYKLMLSMGEAEGIGPITLGLRKPINVIPHGASSSDVFKMAAISVVKAQAEDAML